MGAHESPESTLAAVETDAIRLRAARLAAQFEMDADGTTDMDRADWCAWEGQAYAILCELARG